MELRIKLKAHYKPNESKKVILDKLAQIYQNEFNIDIYMMRGRKKEIITKKQSLSYVLRLLGFNFKEIANYVGIDHSTVIHSVKQFNTFVEIGDHEALEVYDTLNKYLNMDLLKIVKK
jgi:chromosomal replication initiation ATPase DnaA